MTTQATESRRQPLPFCTRCGSTTKRGSSARKRLRSKRDREREWFLERFATLSERERQVALMIGRGVMPSQIGEQLGINVKTVSTYRSRILEKLEAFSNTEIALALYKLGKLE